MQPQYGLREYEAKEAQMPKECSNHQDKLPHHPVTVSLLTPEEVSGESDGTPWEPADATVR